MKTFWLLTLVSLSACCHHDVRLEFPEADAVAGSYECAVTTGPEKCEPSSVVDPTTLPPGTGASTEIVVEHGNAERALQVVYQTPDARASSGQLLLARLACASCQPRRPGSA